MNNTNNKFNNFRTRLKNRKNNKLKIKIEISNQQIKRKVFLVQMIKIAFKI